VSSLLLQVGEEEDDDDDDDDDDDCSNDGVARCNCCLYCIILDSKLGVPTISNISNRPGLVIWRNRTKRNQFVTNTKL